MALPCNDQHIFHYECIEQWLIKVPVCPICRAKVNAPKWKIRKGQVYLCTTEQVRRGSVASSEGFGLAGPNFIDHLRGSFNQERGRRPDSPVPNLLFNDDFVGFLNHDF